ncbi:hypothetical protein SUNI508_00924 [Seiridium unicorne]|uniref:glucan endo-1,3-beta-D-glucosidase n=1 Tax=Seiridium unicorne TaxID=138068 RepID=A0ABR2V1M9_9PEZI
MERRYSFDSDPGERAPLDNPNYDYSGSPSRRNNAQQSQPHYYQDEPPTAYRDPRRTSPERSGAHPDSNFARLREERRRSRVPGAAVGAVVGTGAAQATTESSRGGPQPPPHRNSGTSDWGGRPPSNITQGADNFGETAAGGLAGIASTVAERNARQSGVEAMRGTEDYGHDHQGYGQQGYGDQSYQRSQSQGTPYDQSYNGYDQGYEQSYGHDYDRGYDYGHGAQQDPFGTPNQYHDASPHLTPMGAAVIPPGINTPTRSQHSFASYGTDPFDDSRYAYGQRLDPRLGQVNPNDIMDDGDDGLDYTRPSARNSMLSLGNSNRSNNAAAGTAATGATGAAVGGTAAGLLGGAKENYAPVKGAPGYQGGGASEYDLGAGGAKEQSEWVKKQTASKKRWRWLIIIVVGLIVAGGIAGGVVGGLMSKNKSGSSKNSSNGGGQSASEDTQENGDLDINSDEIKALLNNANLHKVFPGVDYTPLNTQYPDCIGNPASQNNITRDVAVLSQLTNVIRLYGTDCNQTEMTIHALKQLQMEDDIKIWMGVWQDNNETTNARQLSQMWDILETYGDKYFEGLIVANEILFREQMTEDELGDLLDSVRTNVTNMGLSLKVATSDLGDKWTSSLAAKSDVIMSNIHPFFGGINEKDAASWTWQFWQNHDSGYMKSDASANVISEIGWPSQGGMDCASETVTDCPDQAVAGIDGLNQLLNDWVCDALTNGTNYFWFEMFDEPWKIEFNTDSQQWEDHWGLMDVDRNLKDGVKIPDCGGSTVASISKK